MKDQNKFKNKLQWFIVASLVLHGLFSGSVGWLAKHTARLFERPPTNSVVEIAIETPQTRAEEIKAKQIVDQDKAINDEVPDKEAYLSRHNQHVLKETTAANRGEFQNVKTSPTKPVPSPNLADQLRTKPSPKSAAVPSEVKKTATHEKTLPFDPFGDVRRGLKQKSLDEASSAEEHAQQKAEAQSRPSTSNVSQSNDYLKNVETGNETILNTREFKYFTYYERIRRQLSQHWEPKVHEKLKNIFKQGRTIASNQDHITKLLIILNNQGDLVGVKKVSESGVVDLDDAAVEAFKSAAPFPNPPKGIVDPDGTVKIRWDFVLQS